MLRVLYLINHAGKAGTEAYIRSLADRLSTAGSIEPFLAYHEAGLLSEQMQERGFETFRLVMRHPFDLAAAWKLARLCRLRKIDIIHAQYLRENYIALFSRILNPPVRVIYTNHFILKNNFFLKCCNFLLSGLQAAVVAVCNPGRRRMEKNWVRPGRITVIFNGVDPQYWGNREASTLREEFGIPPDKMILLCGSRFEYDKGHEYLVNAIAALKKRTSRPFVFILANDGPFLETRRRQVRELGLEDTVIFAGHRKDVKNLYDGSDIYVNASWHEALSFAIIEAMAEGLPVVATRMGGNPDIVSGEYGNGILVTYGDADELAEVLDGLMGDPERRRKLSEGGRRAVAEKFNLDIMVSKTYNLYQKVTGQQGGTAHADG